MQLHKRNQHPKADLQDLNQVMVSGTIVSKVHACSETKYVFTLRNKHGWFYVQWLHPNWKPHKSQRVLVRGSIYSVLSKSGNATRIQADEIVLLNAEKGSWPTQRN